MSSALILAANMSRRLSMGFALATSPNKRKSVVGSPMDSPTQDFMGVPEVSYLYWEKLWEKCFMKINMLKRDFHTSIFFYLFLLISNCFYCRMMTKMSADKGNLIVFKSFRVGQVMPPLQLRQVTVANLLEALL